MGSNTKFPFSQGYPQESNTPFTLKGFREVRDEYLGFHLNTSVGCFSILIARGCGIGWIMSEHTCPRDEPEDLEIKSWRFLYSDFMSLDEDIPKEVMEELLISEGVDEYGDKCYCMFLILTPETGEDIYFMVGKKHNGYYSNDALFQYTSLEGITTTIDRTYL